ncbi:MAG TPA: hypothetical protein PKD91_01205, partial [Bacteroidia bacterium]|nr:hypothetical protein [Bacteroidia bacterium]
MKLNNFITAIAILLASCNTQESSKTDEASIDDAEETAPTAEKEKPRNNNFWEPLVWNEYRDNNGVVFASMPFPSSWKVAARPAKGEPSITGPHGIRIVDFPAQSYLYCYD